MSKIIKHGNTVKECTCPKCFCIFEYCQKDIEKSKDTRYSHNLGGFIIIPLWSIHCPECDCFIPIEVKGLGDLLCQIGFHGKGIPKDIQAQLKDIGATPTEFMNMLNNGEGIPEKDRDVNNNTRVNVDMDEMSTVVLQKLRKKYNRR